MPHQISFDDHQSKVPQPEVVDNLENPISVRDFLHNMFQNLITVHLLGQEIYQSFEQISYFFQMLS